MRCLCVPVPEKLPTGDEQRGEGFVFNPMLEQVFNINTMSKYVTFWSILRQRCWGLVLVVAASV